MSHAEATLPALEAAPALASSLAADAPQDLRPMLDEQLSLLGELARLGLEAARAVVDQAKADNPPPASETALAYARVSRAVRLAIMLQGKLIEARDEEEAIQEVFTPRYSRKARVEKIVDRVAVEQCDTEEHYDAVIADMGERLDDEDLYGDLMDRPISEIVARLCKDLGLRPDWSELSQELWAKREAAALTSPNAVAWRGESDRERRSIERPLAERSEEPGVAGEGQAHPACDFALSDSS